MHKQTSHVQPNAQVFCQSGDRFRFCLAGLVRSEHVANLSVHDSTAKLTKEVGDYI